MQTLATAVVQLLTSEPPSHVKWKKELTGVVCFVRDNPRRSYFIRIFDIDYVSIGALCRVVIKVLMNLHFCLASRMRLGTRIVFHF